MKSISAALGGAKNFTRVAIGIGRPEERDQDVVSSYVLSPFEGEVYENVFCKETFPEIYR